MFKGVLGGGNVGWEGLTIAQSAENDQEAHNLIYHKPGSGQKIVAHIIGENDHEIFVKLDIDVTLLEGGRSNFLIMPTCGSGSGRIIPYLTKLADGSIKVELSSPKNDPFRFGKPVNHIAVLQRFKEVFFDKDFGRWDIQVLRPRGRKRIQYHKDGLRNPSHHRYVWRTPVNKHHPFGEGNYGPGNNGAPFGGSCRYNMIVRVRKHQKYEWTYIFIRWYRNDPEHLSLFLLGGKDKNAIKNAQQK